MARLYRVPFFMTVGRNAVFMMVGKNSVFMMVGRNADPPDYPQKKCIFAPFLAFLYM